MVRILVVEDSPVVREFLVHVLGTDPGIEVVGTAANGEEALEAVERSKPDVLTMDIHMPKMDGLEATRRIMETHPLPIVIVSGSSTAKEVTTAFRAMEAGAVAVVQRPAGVGHPEYETTAAELIQTVRLMAEVKVVRRWPRARREDLSPVVSVPAEVDPRRRPEEIKLIAIGASTGGPLALQTILSGLPRSFPLPVIIVQHMADGFTEGFVEWLSQTCNLPIHVARHGERILPGHVYVADEGRQMKVEKVGVLSLIPGEPENGHCPSVSHLFRSVAKAHGPQAVGVLLTGMGSDGAEELKTLKETGAVTIVQDKESSVVHGMPGEAIKLEAATYIVPPEQIPDILKALANRGSRHETNYASSPGINDEPTEKI